MNRTIGLLIGGLIFGVSITLAMTRLGNPSVLQTGKEGFATMPSATRIASSPTAMAAKASPSLTVSTRPSDSTQPSGIAGGPEMPPGRGGPPPVSILPDDYKILQTRNIFAHGRGGRGAGGRGGPGSPEASLVFRGVVKAESSFVAFFEDMAGKRGVQVAVGEPVGNGRIKSIDLDSIMYEVDGSARKIDIGQNLNGETPPPPAPPTPPAAARGGPPGAAAGPPGARGNPAAAAAAAAAARGRRGGAPAGGPPAPADGPPADAPPADATPAGPE
jgi:hypothetical protein